MRKWQVVLARALYLGEPIRKVELGDPSTQQGEVCGPVRLELEGFPAVFGEVLFIPMKPDDGNYEPLVGYIPLEQAGVAVDMVGHRLVKVKRADLKLVGRVPTARGA